MRFLTILFLKFLLLNNFLVAEMLPIKSKILLDSNECIKNPQNQKCKELIFQIERLQLVMFDQNRFKCQSSLLGLQSQLIEAYFLKKLPTNRTVFMSPYVIKNC